MFQKPKGTYDVTPNESHAWRTLETIIHETMHQFNYHYMRTPLFESSDVFHRHSEHSDMVTKETYDFQDRGNRPLTLRPEGTAGIIRSIVENKLIQPGHILPVYYIGPNYRYERPQKGRFREFYQFGVEVIGTPHPSLDADVIILGFRLLQKLTINKPRVLLNSIGSLDTRKKYLQALISYFTPYKDELSKESQHRLKQNPLRILDSKQKEDQIIVSNAPKIIDYLSEEERTYFEEVCLLLDRAEVSYAVTHTLVRGLDYYANTVFEFVSESEVLGTQNALGGGGRYESLVQELGGPEVSGIGFAFGMERLLMVSNLSNPSSVVDVCIITQDASVYAYAYETLLALRSSGIHVFYDFSYKSMKAQLKHASALGATYALIIGEEEYKKHTIAVKDLKTFNQTTINQHDIHTYLLEKLGA